MKQILLVDDDFLALNAFYSLVDWSQLEMHIAFEAHGGSEALAYLEGCAELPSVAFIDVCMPDMDGITLLQTLRARYPSIVCFMLSSHSDYPYVRETLKLGAADYMLKHEISPESIIAALREHGLADALQEPSPSPDQRLAQALSGADDMPLCGFLLYAVYEDSRPLLEAQRTSILQTCRHILNRLPGAAVCAPSEGALAVTIPSSKAQEDAGDAAEVIQTALLLQKALVKYHNVHFSFHSPIFCADGAALVQHFDEMSRQSVPSDKARAAQDERELNQLTLAIASGSKTRLAQVLQALFQSGESDAGELHKRLLAFLARTRLSMGLPAINTDALPHDGMQTFFLQQLSDLCDEKCRRSNAAFSQAIRDALTFIDSHYAEDIQLSDVARHCHVSYTHLSYLFKKETGDNLIRYLTRVRVYHAARMLLFDGLSVSEACQQAGFKSYNHFVTTFKTITGMTPSEFRKNPSAAQWLLSFHRESGES